MSGAGGDIYICGFEGFDLVDRLSEGFVLVFSMGTMELGIYPDRDSLRFKHTSF